MDKGQVDKFLIGLTKLTRETGIAIGDCCCGCYGYPVVLEVVITSSESGYGHDDDGDGSVRWVDPSDNHNWEYCADMIPRETDKPSDQGKCPACGHERFTSHEGVIRCAKCRINVGET